MTIRQPVLQQMLAHEERASKAFDRMTPEEKQAYLRAHPHSKYGNVDHGQAIKYHAKMVSYHEAKKQKAFEKGDRAGTFAHNNALNEHDVAGRMHQFAKDGDRSAMKAAAQHSRHAERESRIADHTPPSSEITKEERRTRNALHRAITRPARR